MKSNDDVLVTGWGHTRFGRSDLDLEQLIAEAAREAMESAGVEPVDVDEIWLGNFNAGLQDFASPASLVFAADPALWGSPATHVENACASGSSAVHAGLRSVLAGTARHVLVIGAEKMTAAGAERVGRSLMNADFDIAGTASDSGFAERFARVAKAYAERKEDPSEAMALIAAKNHAHGLANPLAHLRKEFSAEFCGTVSDQNPVVSGLLRRTDCSPVSDGAAAVILSAPGARSSAAKTRGVRIIGSGQANDWVRAADRRDPLAFAASAQAWNTALRSAGLSVTDLDLVELHDCFTIAELVLYEVLGLSAPGEAISDLKAGRFHRDGDLPVNVSGGLKAKGHPVGATGVSQIVMAAMQLTGTADAGQLPRAERAAVHNMGGLAVANNVTVLASV